MVYTPVIYLEYLGRCCGFYTCDLPGRLGVVMWCSALFGVGLFFGVLTHILSCKFRNVTVSGA